MAQFDVYTNPNQNTNELIPFVIDIQHDILSNIATRVVVPLVKDDSIVNKLNPVFEIDGQKVMMSTSELATIPIEMLGEKLENLSEFRNEIIDAIDFLVTGF